MNLSPIVPPSVAGSFTSASSCDVANECPMDEARCLNSTGRSSSAALCYSAPSRVWNRAADDPKNLRSPGVSTVTRPACLFRSLRRERTYWSFRPSGLHDRLSSAEHRGWSSPMVRRDSHRAVQVNRTFACMISAFDSRRMVRHARTSRQLRRLHRLPSEPGEWLWRNCLYPSPFAIHLG